MSIAMSKTWNGLDGIINDRPFMPGAAPTRQAAALMELAEQDGQLLGDEERRMIFDFAKAVKDYRRVSDLIGELCSNAHELQFGSPDPAMVEYVEREINAAQEAELLALAAAG